MPKKKNSKQKKGSLSSSQDQMDELVDDMYKAEDQPMVEKPQRTVRGYFAFFVAVTVLVGFLSGVIGELAVNNYFYHLGYDITRIWQPQAQDAQREQQVIVFSQEEATTQASQIRTLLDNASQAVAGIYLKKKGDALSAMVYMPRDKVGNALVLTSDGWLVTPLAGMPKESGRELVVITADKKILPVERIAFDKASRVVFIKVRAENLKVVKFSTPSQIYTGLPVMALAHTLIGEPIQSFVTSIVQTAYLPLNSYADYFQSSEEFSKVILASDTLPPRFVGSPIIDMEGGIVGLYDGSGGRPSIILAAHFSDIINQLLKTQAIERPYFGVNYIDLSMAIGFPQEVSEGLTAGALVFGDKEAGIQAVISNSPAAKAGISFGDIILTVNEQTVDARHSLTELLQQYQIGDVVKLTVQNKGKVREVEVGLISIPD